MSITGSPPATNTWTVPPPAGRELFEDNLGVFYWSSPAGTVDASGKPTYRYKIRNAGTMAGTTISAIERARTPARENKMAITGQTAAGQFTVNTYAALRGYLDRFKDGSITLGEFKQLVSDKFEEGKGVWSNPDAKTKEFLEDNLTADQLLQPSEYRFQTLGAPPPASANGDLTIEEIEDALRNNIIDQDQAREFIRAALIKAGHSESGVDQQGSLILNSMLQRITTDVAGAGAGAAADGTLWRDPIISEPSFGQAFSRFIGGTPFAATPGLMSAAAAMRPIAQTQFQLQPSTPVWDPETGELQPRDIGEFSRFLPGAFGGGAGGSFLRGGDLSQRLSELTRALFRERGEGDNPINPFVDTRQAQLFQEFGDPQNTFSAFNLPGLMATQGRGRALLAAAQDRFRNRWLGQNPNATGYDVANLFGRYTV